MTKSSKRRKALRLLYRKAKGKLPKDLPKAPMLDTISALRTPKVKRALSRVIEFESRRPGEFAKWIEDLHIEHFRAGIQDKLNEERRKNSEKQATAEGETVRLVENKGSEGGRDLPGYIAQYG